MFYSYSMNWPVLSAACMMLTAMGGSTQRRWPRLSSPFTRWWAQTRCRLGNTDTLLLRYFGPEWQNTCLLLGRARPILSFCLAAGWQVRHTREASWRHLPEDGRQQRREAHQTGPILCQVELCHHPWITLAWKILETFTLWHPTQEFVRGCLNDTNLLQLLAPGTQWVDIQ